MEYVLRCNELKCRTQLHDQAVVTTCSHLFCTSCADSTGLSRSTNAHRTCPACRASLHNPDDVVVAGLNPSEDYKTSVLSGLSPTIIIECASRGLAFHSYQTFQEIVYQEHLAKGLTEKYTTLSQQMDQLIHDANSQIKALQEKLQAMQTEQVSLEAKNHELIDAFKEKSRAHQQIQKLYQSLKAQVMASHVANAAGDEAELTLQTAQADRYITRLPGTRTGTANLNQIGAGQQASVGRPQNRQTSRSSGSCELRQGGIRIGSPYVAQGRVGGTQTRESASYGTPSQAHRSRLPVLGGTRQNSFSHPDAGPSYRASPMTRQSFVDSIGARNASTFVLDRKRSLRAEGMANDGPLGR